HAEGEYMAAEKLAMAANVIQKEPSALQLRYLQTLVEIGQEKNSTVIFPVPMDLIPALTQAIKKTEATKE
ncbi:MAG TPA: slipin family protein, partial [Bryobacteraceae bacterium]|nr:slipin family protein [Bryobacteraceae bacterium]